MKALSTKNQHMDIFISFNYDFPNLEAFRISFKGCEMLSSRYNTLGVVMSS